MNECHKIIEDSKGIAGFLRNVSVKVFKRPWVMRAKVALWLSREAGVWFCESSFSCPGIN